MRREYVSGLVKTLDSQKKFNYFVIMMKAIFGDKDYCLDCLPAPPSTGRSARPHEVMGVIALIEGLGFTTQDFEANMKEREQRQNFKIDPEEGFRTCVSMSDFFKTIEALLLEKEQKEA
jgi:hypothetical protein